MRRPFAYLAVSTILLLVAALAPLRLLPAGAQEAALPAIGDPVTFPVGEGDGTATVTVTQVVDPFGAFGSGAAPEGERFVYVAITVANGSDAPITLDPATIFVVDAAGFVHRPAEVFAGGGASEPQEIAPGEEIDGGVVVAVPEDAALAAVYHDPAEDRLILLAVLGGAPAADGDDEGGDGEDDGDGEESTPESPGDGDDGDDDGDNEDDGDGGDVTPVVVGDVDCAEFETYYADINDRLARLEEIASGMEDLVNLVTTDPTGAATTVQEWADAMVALAEEQGNAEVPAGLEELNDQAVEMFNTYADAFEQLARGLASFDVTAIQGIIPILEEGDALATATIDQLGTIAEGCGIEVVE